jgi:hypothetical protein
MWFNSAEPFCGRNKSFFLIKILLLHLESINSLNYSVDSGLRVTYYLYLLIIVDLESIVENMWRNFFAEPLSGREQIFFLNQNLTITSWKHVIVPRGLWIKSYILFISFNHCGLENIVDKMCTYFYVCRI